MKYCAPTVQSFSKEDIRKNIVASATCVEAVCGTGTTFTCGVGSNYVHRTPDEMRKRKGMQEI